MTLEFAMMSYCPECDWQLEIARRLVRKDHKQRWVYYRGDGVYSISEEPIPYKDAISVRWVVIPGCVVHAYRERALAHPSIGAF